MALLQELFVYPLKSGRAIPGASVRLAPSGFEWDRHWMTVDATGAFVTQRTHPQLARIEPSLERGTLILRAPGLSPLTLPLAPRGESIPVRIWQDRCTALDQGDEVSTWLSEAHTCASYASNGSNRGCEVRRDHSNTRRIHRRIPDAHLQPCVARRAQRANA